MSKRKTLANVLRERTDTIEYCKVKSELMKTAQNKQNTYRIIRLEDKTIIRLQNEGITVEKITEFNQEKYLLSW